MGLGLALAHCDAANKTTDNADSSVVGDEARDGEVEKADGGQEIDLTEAGMDASEAPLTDSGGATEASLADAHLDSMSDVDTGTDSGGTSLSDASPAHDGGSDAATDTGVDAGPRSLRDEVCGDRTTWPAPLPTSTAQRVARAVGTETFGFLEGPVWVADQGVLLFSDMDFGADDAQGPPSRIRRLHPPATFDEFVASSNSNGLALSRDGALLAVTHDNQGLSRFSLQSGQRTPIEVRFEGDHHNSPNDLTVRSDGTVFFTDPDWQLGQRSSESGQTGAYRVAPPLRTSSNNSSIALEETLTNPNGIALSPDERTLYIGSAGNEIWKYNVAADGSVSNRSMFANTGASDGMTVDCAGNLYVASGSIEVFAPNGTPLGQITLADEPSNVAFGGADRKTLYITAGSRLYSLTLNVSGFPF